MPESFAVFTAVKFDFEAIAKATIDESRLSILWEAHAGVVHFCLGDGSGPPYM
jgi:hypothetical protein